MKAVITQTLDSTWANAVTVQIEAELDNAHPLTTKQLATLAIHTMRTFIEEVRAENERHAYSEITQQGGERDRYDEMMRERGAPDAVRGKGER